MRRENQKLHLTNKLKLNTMKSVVKEKQAENKAEYPCLKISTNETVVLFTSKGTGTLIHNPNGTWPIGYYSRNWIEVEFTPFSGTIELSND